MRIFTKILTLFVVALFCSTQAFAQENGDYRSNGDGDWSDAGIWQTYDGNGWIAAGSAPTGSENITIQASDSVAIDMAVTIDGHVTLAGSGPEAGGILEVVTGGSLAIGDGGTYEHARDGGNVPTADWQTGSTIVFSGLLGEAPGNRAQAYHNLVWNNTGQISNLSLGLGTIIISGDVRLVSSGDNRFRLTDSGSGDGQTITIQGDVIVEGGAIETTGSGDTAEYNVEVMGNVEIHGGTTFATSRGSGGQATWTVHGDFTAFGDAELRDSHDGDASRVVFGGSTTQNVSISTDASYNGAFNFTVAAGADVVVTADSTFHFEDDFSTEGNLTVNGEIIARDTLKINGGALTVANGGTYNHAYDAGEIPTATWADGSTVKLTGIETNDPDNGDQDFFNYVWDNAGQIENINIGWDNYTLRGNLTVLNSNGSQFRLSSAGDEGDPARSITISGDVVVDGENAEFTATGSGDIFDYEITVMGDVSVLNGGFLSASRGSGGRAVWTLYGDMTIDGGEIGDSDTDKHGQFRTFVFAADTASDGVPGQTITANNVSYDSDVYFEIADSSGVLLASGSDFTYEGIFTNHGVFDVAGDATLTFAGDATYDHARDGGDVPTAVWAEGSTALFSGMETSGPGNANQDFYNIVINSPNNIENNDFGMRDNTIYGDIHVVSTGSSSRAYLTNPDSYDTLSVTIMGDINMEQGAFSTNGTGSGATEINIHHYGNINVADGNFSISRGSGPIVNWYMYEGNFSMAAGKTQNSNARAGGAFIFTGEEVVQTIDVSADVDMSNLPVVVDSGAYLDMGLTSFEPNGDNFTVNAGATIATADTGGFGVNLDLSGSGETQLTMSPEAHYVLNGSEKQQTGMNLPLQVETLTIDNPAGVVQSRGITVNNYLQLNAGVFENTFPNLMGEGAYILYEGGSLLNPLEGFGAPPSREDIVWDFEDPAQINGWVNGESSVQTFAGSDDATEGDSSLSWTYTVDPSLEWGGSADFELSYGEFLTDLSDFDGFSFDYKVVSPVSPSDGGASLNLKVYSQTPDTLVQHHYTVPNVLSDDSGEWQTAEIVFEDLAIPSWISGGITSGYNTDLHPAAITKIEMQVIVGSDGSEVSGEILLDNAVPYEKPDVSNEKEGDSRPVEFALNQNYPNPFNPTTTISYDVPKTADVTLKVYDITGREVAELVNTRKNAGSHNVTWDASQFASGVYLYRIQAGDFTAVRKLTLIK